MLEEFFFLYVLFQIVYSMWNKQMWYLSFVFKFGVEVKKIKIQRMIEDVEKWQEVLVGILKKDLDYNFRMVKVIMVIVELY